MGQHIYTRRERTVRSMVRRQLDQAIGELSIAADLLGDLIVLDFCILLRCGDTEETYEYEDPTFDRRVADRFGIAPDWLLRGLP